MSYTLININILMQKSEKHLDKGKTTELEKGYYITIADRGSDPVCVIQKLQIFFKIVHSEELNVRSTDTQL